MKHIMKTYTTAQVAKITKRHSTSIARLVTTGKLKGVKGKSKAGRPTYIIDVESPSSPNGGRTEKDVLIGLVHGLLPKGGFRKKVTPKASNRPPANLAQVLRFMELPEERRELLLTLGEKTTDANIELLIGLV